MLRLALASRAAALGAVTLSRSAAPAAAAGALVRRMGTMSPDLFEKQYARLTRQLFDGLENMKTPDSEPFDLTLVDGTLQLDLGPDGRFAVEVERGSTVVTVTSPRTGVRTYTYSADNDAWEDTADGHNMLEMIARDVTWLRSGFPTF